MHCQSSRSPRSVLDMYTLQHRLTRSGQIYHSQQKVNDEFQSYQSMLPHLSNLPSTIASDLQHYSYRETLFARYCMMVKRHVQRWSSDGVGLLPPSAVVQPIALLNPFRAYKGHWNLQLSLHARKSKSDGGVSPWIIFYDTLSILLQQGIVQPIFSSKISLRQELKAIEADVDDRIMTLFKFPRADQPSSQVESFVDQVMANWRSMCRFDWSEEEIGEGGRATLCREILTVCVPLEYYGEHVTHIGGCGLSS